MQVFFPPILMEVEYGSLEDDFSLQGVISSPLIMEGKASGMMYLFATRILQKHRVLSMAMVATISQRHQFDVIVWD